MGDRIRAALSFDRVLTRFDLLFSVFVLVVGMLFTAGATYARVRGDIDDVRLKVKAIEDDRKEKLQTYDTRTRRLERNVVKIGAKLGLDMETE